MKNPYEVLGASVLDSKDVIKTKYRLLCKKYHPDAPTGDSNKFHEIQEAWEYINSSDNSFVKEIWVHDTMFKIKKRGIN